MSHFLLGVILDNTCTLEEQMMPFSANVEVERHIHYTRQEALEDMCKWGYIDAPMLTDDVYHGMASDWFFGVGNASEDQIDAEGNIWSTCNPKSKWDCYEVGGRWKNHLRLKNGLRTDIAKIKDLDLSFNQKDYDEALRYWEVAVEGSKLKDGEYPGDFHCFEGPDFLLKAYGDKESYAKARVWYSFYALLLDGKWYEEGKVACFGMSDSTPESVRAHEALIKKVLNDPEMQERLIVVVDCHI